MKEWIKQIILYDLRMAILRLSEGEYEHAARWLNAAHFDLKRSEDK